MNSDEAGYFFRKKHKKGKFLIDDGQGYDIQGQKKLLPVFSVTKKVNTPKTQ